MTSEEPNQVWLLYECTGDVYDQWVLVDVYGLERKAIDEKVRRGLHDDDVSIEPWEVK